MVQQTAETPHRVLQDPPIYTTLAIILYPAIPRRETRAWSTNASIYGWDEIFYLPELSTSSLDPLEATPGSPIPAMVAHPSSSSDRHANGRSGAGNGHGRTESTPGTPRKERSVGKEKAVQDPGLKDYVWHTKNMGGTYWLTYGTASRGMLGKGSIWFSIQSFQLGYRRSCSHQANQAWGPPEERVTDDRGMGTSN